MPQPGSGVAPGLVVDDLPATTVQCHAANLMPLPQGDLGCVWFGGTQEGVADIDVWFARRAAGQASWTAPRRLSQDPSRSEQNPILFPAPDGSLWLLHTAQRSGDQDTAVVRARRSLDGGATWSAAQDLFNKAGVFVRQPVVVLGQGPHAGDWLVPIFHCRTQAGVRWSGDMDDSAVMISSDQGRSWTEHAVPQSLGCVHMNIVQSRREPGRLLAFFRSRWADHVYRSESSDGGRHWAPPQATALPNNNSSIQVIVLASGRLAMVLNPTSAQDATERRVSLYDELDGEAGASYAPSAGNQGTARRAFWGTPRAPLSVVLSEDEGLTWPYRRDLETGDGYCMTNNSSEQRNRELSYPSITQTADAQMHVAYTHHRQRIRHLWFDEAWALSPTPTAP